MIEDRVRQRNRVPIELLRAQWEQEITERLNAELGNSSYYAVRRVLCEFCDGTLILRGQVPSYFLKQIAQTVVRRGSNGSVRIENQLEVICQR